MIPRRPWLHAARLVDAALFFPTLILVVWGELGNPDQPGLGLLAGLGDKPLHLLAYFVLAAMAAAAFKDRKPVWIAGFGLIVLGGVLELLQGYTGREMSVYDQIANMTGVLAGGIGARAIVEPLRRRLT